MYMYNIYIIYICLSNYCYYLPLCSSIPRVKLISVSLSYVPTILMFMVFTYRFLLIMLFVKKITE